MKEPPGRRRPGGWEWRRDGIRALVLVAVTLLIYANSIGNGFVYDDIAAIGDDPRRDSAGDVRVFFTTSYWNEVSRGLYRPLTTWSWAIDNAVFGPGPLPVHLSNVIAGSLLAGLVYAFLFLVLQNRDLAFVAALLFATHPVHTEVMANGVGRSEIYSGVFLMTAAIVHIRGIGFVRGPVPPIAYPLLGSVLYLIAMLFKESAAVLPGLLFLAEWIVLRRGDLNAVLRTAWRYIPYAAVLGLYLMIRVSVVGSETPPVQEVMSSLSGPDRILYSSKTLIEYLGQLAVPWTLLAEYTDYRTPILASLKNPLVSVSLILWIALAALCVVLVRRQKFIPLFGISWFLLTILPASNPLFAIGTIRADRLLFLPSLGFTIALAWALLEVGKRWRAPALGILVVILAFYGWKTVTRNPDWRTQESLWVADLAKNPGASIGWALLGDVYRDRGDLDRAEEAYLKSIELRDSISFYPESHNNYAAIVGRRDLEEAKRHYRMVVAHDPNQYTALVNLGAMLLDADSTRAESIDLLERAVRVKPEEPAPRVNLAQAYKFAGDHRRALVVIDEALRLSPDHPDFWGVKATILTDAGRHAEAREASLRSAQLRGN